MLRSPARILCMPSSFITHEQYTFWRQLIFSPLNDVNSFVTLSATFEGVGTAAYTGAANLLSDPTHVIEAASILATEWVTLYFLCLSLADLLDLLDRARQAAWVMSSVKKQNPWSTSFEVRFQMTVRYIFWLWRPDTAGSQSSLLPREWLHILLPIHEPPSAYQSIPHP